MPMIPSEFRIYLDEVDRIAKQAALYRQSPVKTPEQEFRDLGVLPGDRVRLTQAAQDTIVRQRKKKDNGSVLEGVVNKTKVKGGKSFIQIRGFDVAGNQVYWPVADYIVEVLHRVYRPTEDDLLIAEIAGLTEHTWRTMTDVDREGKRKTYGPRLAKLKARLAPSVSGGQVIASGAIPPLVNDRNGGSLTFTNTHKQGLI